MKVHLHPSLRSALLAAMLVTVNYTLSSAQVVEAAQSQQEIEQTKFTTLNPQEPSLTATPSAFMKEEVTGSLPHIIKYLYDAILITYTPVQNSVLLSEPLADTEPNEAESPQLAGQQVKDTSTNAIFEPLELMLVSASTLTDMEVYSSNTTDYIDQSVNVTADTSATAQGGAIYNDSRITDITAKFTNNSATATATATAIARGGAIYNQLIITNITGDFKGNFASASAITTATAQGGAIYNLGGHGSARAFG